MQATDALPAGQRLKLEFAPSARTALSLSRSAKPSRAGGRRDPVVTPPGTEGRRRSVLQASSPAENSLAYQRMRDLPRLLRVWPKEIECLDLVALADLVERLEKALFAERRRGISRHWGYDLGRHAGLLRAYRSERAELEAQQDRAKYRTTGGAN